MNENNIERENSMQCETVGTAVTDRVEVTDKSNDPYAYLERSEFTSEKFKIEIRNLPKYYGFNVSLLCHNYIPNLVKSYICNIVGRRAECTYFYVVILKFYRN